MKKTWMEPQITVEQFMANEYVAACGDTEYGVYMFKCDAPGGRLYYYRNGRESGDADYLGSYNPCGASHEASTTDPFYDGFVDYDKDGKEDANEMVIVWRGSSGRNGHATSNLNQDSWEVTKS